MRHADRAGAREIRADVQPREREQASPERRAAEQAKRAADIPESPAQLEDVIVEPKLLARQPEPSSPEPARRPVRDRPPRLT